MSWAQFFNVAQWLAAGVGCFLVTVFAIALFGWLWLGAIFLVWFAAAVAVGGWRSTANE